MEETTEKDWEHDGGNPEYELYLEKRAKEKYEAALKVLRNQPEQPLLYSIAHLAESVDELDHSIKKSLAVLITKSKWEYRSSRVKNSLNAIIAYLQKDYLN